MSAVKKIIRDNYNMMLLHDYLRREIKDAGFSHFNIQKQPTGTMVSVYVVRPGVVIGRKGMVIRSLTEQLETNFDYKSPQIRVEEIEHPELSPSVMCNRMASHIERGTAFRRATMWVLRQVMEGGAMGVQITVSGKLRGDRSSFEKHTVGILPRAGHHAQMVVDEDIAHVKTPMGLIGIRIRIAHREKIVPDFSLNGESDKRDTQKPSEKPAKRQRKPYDKPYGKPYGKPGSRPYGKPGGKPYGKPYDKPYGKPYDKPGGKPGSRPYGKPGGRQDDKSGGKQDGSDNSKHGGSKS